jgi:hypothetical protein
MTELSEAAPGVLRSRASALRGFVLRFLLIVTVLAALAAFGEERLVEALLPGMKYELTRLDGTFRIDQLSVVKDGADRAVRVEVGLARPLALNGRTFYPDPRGKASASTLVGNAILPCVLLIAVALAWPVRSLRSFAARALLLIPLLLLLLALDGPFLLWGALWGLVLQAAGIPNAFSPLLIWSDFLLNGGGLALALVLGACVAAVAERLSNR